MNSSYGSNGKIKVLIIEGGPSTWEMMNHLYYGPSISWWADFKCKRVGGYVEERIVLEEFSLFTTLSSDGCYCWQIAGKVVKENEMGAGVLARGYYISSNAGRAAGCILFY